MSETGGRKRYRRLLIYLRGQDASSFPFSFLSPRRNFAVKSNRIESDCETSQFTEAQTRSNDKSARDRPVGDERPKFYRGQPRLQAKSNET